jgi:hypothetical protein
VSAHKASGDVPGRPRHANEARTLLNYHNGDSTRPGARQRAQRGVGNLFPRRALALGRALPMSFSASRQKVNLQP